MDPSFISVGQDSGSGKCNVSLESSLDHLLEDGIVVFIITKLPFDELSEIRERYFLLTCLCWRFLFHLDLLSKRFLSLSVRRCKTSSIICQRLSVDDYERSDRTKKISIVEEMITAVRQETAHEAPFAVYTRWEVWKSVPCRSCIFFVFQRLRVVPEILVSDKILNFVRHLSESSTYILQIISERNAHTFPDITSRFNRITTSREMDNNMLPIRGSKWISALRNLERISFKHGSQSGSVLRTVDLLTFPAEEFKSDSTYFFLGSYNVHSLKIYSSSRLAY